METTLRRSGGPVVAGLVVLCLLGASCLGADYQVGPGKRYTTLAAVPWLNLVPGDRVRIYWKSTPYREKLLLSVRGAASHPIRIVGVPGPKGELPVIDGTDATTGKQMVFPYAPTQDRGVIIVTPTKGQRWGHKPAYLHLEGLEVRGGYRGQGSQANCYSDFTGTKRYYSHNAASIFVERGEHIVIRNCTITGSGNGLFVASGDSEEVQSRDILVEGCYIHGNGLIGRDQEHNVYTEAIGTVFQYNRLGRLRPGSLGGNLKDRSAGTVVRCNWVEGGARLLDLVEPQGSAKLATKVPSFAQTFVYGNVFVVGPKDAVQLIHYGGDCGITSNYRRGTLYFYHNTLVAQADQKERWRIVVFQVELNEATVDARNNILFCQARTPGAAAPELTLLLTTGTLKLGVNWISPGWLQSRSGLPFKGSVSGASNLVVGRKNEPGFVNLAKHDFRLNRTSPCIDKGEGLPSEVTKAHALTRQYRPHQAGEDRKVNGKASDLGAFEGSSSAVTSSKPLPDTVSKGPARTTDERPQVRPSEETGKRDATKLESDTKARPYLNYAKKLLARGMKEKARERLREVVKKFPDTPSALEASRLLKDLVRE
jgi:hypothetical protein